MIRNIGNEIAKFRRSPKKIIITIVLSAILIALSLSSAHQKVRQGVDYRTLLERTAFTVEGQPRTFREAAFYVFYEEQLVEEQAKVYDPDDTSKYWNAHPNGVFVRVAARNAAVQMAVHDEIFYQMAVADGISLNGEERQKLSSVQDDIWADLIDYDKDKKLGVSRQDMDATVERMMYAQKYQLIYANLQNETYEDYEFDADSYKKLLESVDYEVEEEPWKALSFGKITLPD